MGLTGMLFLLIIIFTLELMIGIIKRNSKMKFMALAGIIGVSSILLFLIFVLIPAM